MIYLITQPIKITELCSSNSASDTQFYDVQSPDSEYQLNKVSYAGIKCDCMGVQNPDKCRHADVVSDNGLIHYYIGLLTTNIRYYG